MSRSFHSRLTAPFRRHLLDRIPHRSLVVSAKAQPQRKMDLLAGVTFFLDSFALRQWDDPNYGGTRISYDKVWRLGERSQAASARLAASARMAMPAPGRHASHHNPLAPSV